MSVHPEFEAPLLQQLPSTGQLRRATVVGVLVAIVIVIVAVLPAEKGIDPTGVGRVIGLEDMGLWKVDLAKEMAEAEVFRAQRLAADSSAATKRP